MFRSTTTVTRPDRDRLLDLTGAPRASSGGAAALSKERAREHGDRDAEVHDEPGHVDERRGERGDADAGSRPTRSRTSGSMLPAAEPNVTTPARLSQTAAPIRYGCPP